MAIGERIKFFRDKLDMTQDVLAEKIHTTKQTIYKYENNIITNIPSDKIERLAEVFGINPATLMGWETEKPNVEPVSIGKTVSIPVYGRIPAGSPAEATEYIEDYIDVPLSTAKGKELLALKVVGDSMYPKYIEGDYVLIQKQPDCESGQDCAVRVNGSDVTLKKVIKERDGIMLQPINPEYAPKKYDYTDEFNPVYIIGIVIELRRKV